MNTNPRDANILLVGDDPFIAKLAPMLRTLEYSSVEEYGDKKYIGTFLRAKRSRTTYNLIIINSKESPEEASEITAQTEREAGFDMPPTLFMANEGLLSVQSIRQDQLCVENPIGVVELDKAICGLFERSYPSGFSTVFVEKREQHVVIRLPQTITQASIREVLEQFERIESDQNQKIILNFRPVIKATFALLRELFQVLHKYRRNPSHVACVGLRSDMENTLVQQGIDSAFQIKPTYRKALQDLGLPAPDQQKREFASINVDQINPFILASVQQMKQSFHVLFAPGAPKTTSPKDLCPDIFARVRLVVASDAFSFGVGFDRKNLIKLIQNTLDQGEELSATSIHDKMRDVLREIYQKAASGLEEIGYQVSEYSLQILSKDETQGALQDSVVLTIPLETEQARCDLIVASPRPSQEKAI